MTKKEEDEALANLERSLDDTFRRNWRLRRMRDFSRPYRVPSKPWRGTVLTRAGRERTSAMLLSAADTFPDSLFEPFAQIAGLSIDQLREVNRDLARWIAPRLGRTKTRAPRRNNRGRPPTYDARRLVEGVLAMRQTMLLLGQGQVPTVSGRFVRMHLISSRPSRWPPMKLVVEHYLRACTGKDPGPAEVQRIVVRFCQLFPHLWNTLN